MLLGDPLCSHGPTGGADCWLAGTSPAVLTGCTHCGGTVLQFCHPGPCMETPLAPVPGPRQPLPWASWRPGHGPPAAPPPQRVFRQHGGVGRNRGEANGPSIFANRKFKINYDFHRNPIMQIIIIFFCRGLEACRAQGSVSPTPRALSVMRLCQIQAWSSNAFAPFPKKARGPLDKTNCMRVCFFPQHNCKMLFQI